MVRNGYSGLGHVVMVLLLSIIFHQTESALPSDHQKLSIAGRRMMTYYEPSGIIRTPPSTSQQGPGRHGRKLMSIYKPNGTRPSYRGRRGGYMNAGPSRSGRGSGYSHQPPSP